MNSATWRTILAAALRRASGTIAGPIALRRGLIGILVIGTRLSAILPGVGAAIAVVAGALSAHGRPATTRAHSTAGTKPGSAHTHAHAHHHHRRRSAHWSEFAAKLLDHLNFRANCRPLIVGYTQFIFDVVQKSLRAGPHGTLIVLRRPL